MDGRNYTATEVVERSTFRRKEVTQCDCDYAVAYNHVLRTYTKPNCKLTIEWLDWTLTTFLDEENEDIGHFLSKSP